MGVVAPERERTEQPPPPPSRVPSGFPWGGVLAIVGVIVLIVAVRDWLPDLIPSIPNPFAETTIDRTHPAVLRSVRDLNEYHAAGGHYEVVVDIQKDTPLPATILGERTLFIGVGDVDSVVDFGGLGDDAITMSRDRRDATILVPPPRIGRPQLDLHQSYVYDRDRGVLNQIGGLFSDDTGAQQQVYLAAERQIGTAARQGGLNARARTNTRAMLQSLLGGLGFTHVTVRFEDEG
jgi:hypothetical protein